MKRLSPQVKIFIYSRFVTKWKVRYLPVMFWLIVFPSMAIHPEIEDLTLPDPGTPVQKLEYAILNTQKSVGTFEKIEIGIRLPRSIESEIEKFLNQPYYQSGLNPYDPGDIDLWAEFTSPDGKAFRVNGFYYRDYQRATCTSQNYPCWIEKVTDYSWRIRFAANVTGRWTCVIKTNAGKGSHKEMYQTESFFINCIESGREGYLKADKKKLVYSKNGKIFLPVGLNTDWYQWGIVNTSIGDHYKDYFDEISRNGGNLASLAILNRIGLQFEWEQLGVYENPKAESKSHDYNANRQAHAWEIDGILQQAEEKGIYIKFTLLQHPDFEDNSWEWGQNPYHRGIPAVQRPIDFFRDTSAFVHFRKKLRYIVARWGYSDHIAWYELFTEIDNVPGFEADQKAVYDWFDKSSAALKSFDNNNHLVGGSYSTYRKGNDPRYWVWHSQYCDIVNIHSYGQDKRKNFDRFESVRELSSIFPEKPVVFGEMGSYPEPAVENVTRLQFHNSLWATLFMGCMGPGISWFWEPLITRGYCSEFRQIKDFSARVDFSQDWIARRYPGNSSALIKGKNYHVESFYLTAADKRSAAGWVHNATVYWYNQGLPPVKNQSGSVVKPNDDDKWDKPQIFRKDVTRIEGLLKSKPYCFTPYLITIGGLVKCPSVLLKSSSRGKLVISTFDYFKDAADFAFTLDSGECN